MATTYRMRSTMSLKSYNASMKYTINSQKISTHLLTVLIICVIVHAEQRKRERNQRDAKSPGDFQNLPDNRFQIF